MTKKQAPRKRKNPTPSNDRCVVLFPASLIRVPGHLSHQFPVLIGTTGSYASSASFALRLRSPSTGATRFTFSAREKGGGLSQVPGESI
jgi:hypothetical protein